jgi:hypothetical protein
MENTNNTIIPETIIQNPITPEPSKPNIFKYLFIISIVVLLIVVISFVFILNSKNTNTSLIQKNPTTPTEIINQIIPTDTPKVNVSYKANSIQDDKNSVSKLVLTDQNQKEIIIQKDSYLDEINGIPVKPNYNNFIFSPDYNFLSYNYNSWDFGTSFLYDIKNGKKIDLNFPAETTGFTSDSKYFYACAAAGMNSGGAIILELSQTKNIFSGQKEKSYSCNYDKNNKEIILSEFNDIDGKESAQYKFSEISGIILKTK